MVVPAAKDHRFVGVEVIKVDILLVNWFLLDLFLILKFMVVYSFKLCVLVLGCIRGVVGAIIGLLLVFVI